MTLFLPIVGYVLAEGTGSKAMSVEGMLNAANLRLVERIISQIEANSQIIINQSDEKYAGRQSAFDFFGGSRVVFEPEIFAKMQLEEILKAYIHHTLCILVPSRKAFYRAYDDAIMQKIVDREMHGYEIQVISVDCPKYPLNDLSHVLPGELRGRLIANAMETELFGRSSVQSSKHEKEDKVRRAMKKFM